MCGIAGILNRHKDHNVDSALLVRMGEAIAHRGPDDSGEYLNGSVGLAHRRLSVIDLAGGHQPMINDTNGSAIIYNGELYNFRELRAQYFAGQKFNTNSDTEVLLRLLNFESVGWLEELNGMIAFAAWDPTSETLMLARDRLGVKPLYYVMLPDAFVFASEIKSLLEHPAVQRRINIAKIPEYIAFRSICGTETMFEGIYELPPGHALRISPRDFQPRIERWWTPVVPSRRIGRNVAEADVMAEFEAEMQAAVKRRLIADVPLGAFNSGGVDSSLISAIIRTITEGELHTFSVGFEEADFDESRYSGMVAERFQTNHHTLVIGESEYLQSFEETLFRLEEPINHAHTVQLMLLSRFAREYVTVAVTGEGADELFGGYPRQQIAALASYWRHAPRILSKSILRLAQATGQRRVVKLLESAGDVRTAIINNARHVPREDFDLIYPSTQSFPVRDELVSQAIGFSDSVISQTLFYDQASYLPPLLSRLDKVSMATALECRVPFLDPKLLAWSHGLDDHWKLRPGRANKYIVKKVAEKWLPHELIYRRKVGFGTPVARWLRNKKGLGGYLDVLSDDTFRSRGLFEPGAINRLVDEHTRSDSDHSEILWGLLNFELWCRMFIDQVPSLNNIPLTGTVHVRT